MELPSLIILLFVVPAVFGGLLNYESSAVDSIDNENEDLKKSNGFKRAIKLPEKLYTAVDKQVSQLNDSDYEIGFSAMKEYAPPLLRAMLDGVKNGEAEEPLTGRRGLSSMIWGDEDQESSIPTGQQVMGITTNEKPRNEMRGVAEILLTFAIKYLVKLILQMIF